MTYNFFIYIIVASTLLACKTIPANEQVLHPVLKTGLYEYNLKGPVKTAKEYGKYTSKNLSKENRAFYSASNFVNIFLRTSYSTFDKNKMRTVRQSLNGSFDSVYSDTIQRDRLKTYIYIYDINDFEKKKNT